MIVHTDPLPPVRISKLSGDHTGTVAEWVMFPPQVEDADGGEEEQEQVAESNRHQRGCDDVHAVIIKDVSDDSKDNPGNHQDDTSLLKRDKYRGLVRQIYSLYT